ncbi:U4/U6.U5 small nuclear ribonucleoprotein 27 kDa protein [Senna tora]|uniref:U4/U6.U5 small nuclear ribonucleoprotein 27 kDa protein n=1 Tax=Senna tora TaxID=362788 RepID=A0A834X5C5_9FABA|nr:U4/U6.U5 small nuclear ribonucleoprotein 27 kDa protein [Senna tora]
MSDRDRARDRDRERRRDKEDRDRERKRSRSRTPDRGRSRHTRSRTRSPDRYRSPSRSRSPAERSHRRRQYHHRTPSPEPHRKRHRRESTAEDNRDTQKAVSDFVDGIAKEQQQKHKDNGEGAMDEDEMEMMKKLGIPTGFDTTKGKPVPGADVSGVRAVTKRQPRQYMNRRGGFNRPLPAERNR